MKQASAKREIFFQLKIAWWWARGKVWKGSGDKYMSYCITISNYEKVEKHPIVVTSDVYLNLVLLKLLMLIMAGFFQVHLDFTHHCFLHSKSCVAYFQVYQRCRSLGTTLGCQPLLFMKDPHYTSRQGTQLNFWKETHTVCFGRYDLNYSSVAVMNALWRFKG